MVVESKRTRFARDGVSLLLSLTSSMTGPTPPVLASVRLPEVLPGSGGAEVELPPANKFSIAWQDGQQRHELSRAPTGHLSDSEGERGGSGSGLLWHGLG